LKCTLRLHGEPEDFLPKFDKLKPEDADWFFGLEKQKGYKHLRMNLEEAIRFLTMFNEIEEIVFEVK
jgi:hypothetical protein